MSVQTMEGVQMFHRLGLRDCPSSERRFVPIGPCGPHSLNTSRLLWGVSLR